MKYRSSSKTTTSHVNLCSDEETISEKEKVSEKEESDKGELSEKGKEIVEEDSQDRENSS